jgi:HAD superfamily hydrolase (TIGR01509 family)
MNNSSPPGNSPRPGAPSSPGFRALLFDLDGVLLDSEPLHKEAKREAFARLRRTVPERHFLDFRGRTDEAFAEIVGSELGMTPEERTEVLRLKHALFAEGERRIPPVPGALSFLSAARGRYEKLALATSAIPRLQAFAFDHLGLHPFFDAVVNAADITRPKPDPEPYLLAAARVGVAPEACLVIEDSRNGILSGLAAGCAVAALTTSYRREELLDLPVLWIVDGYAELAEKLNMAPLA